MWQWLWDGWLNNLIPLNRNRTPSTLKSPAIDLAPHRGLLGATFSECCPNRGPLCFFWCSELMRWDMCLNLIVWFIPVNPRYPSGYYPHSVAISPSLQFKPELPNCWVPRCRFDQTHRLAAPALAVKQGPHLEREFKLSSNSWKLWVQVLFNRFFSISLETSLCQVANQNKVEGPSCNHYFFAAGPKTR